MLFFGIYDKYIIPFKMGLWLLHSYKNGITFTLIFKNFSLLILAKFKGYFSWILPMF